MIIGTVIGNVWATRKTENLSGSKLMVVKPREYGDGVSTTPLVAVDTIGAGIGEEVLVVSGSSARVNFGDGKAPVDAMIVGIIDKVDLAN
jgi:ethanolamine utilization protein EutN